MKAIGLFFLAGLGVSIIAALVTGDWRWLIVALLCYFPISKA